MFPKSEGQISMKNIIGTIHLNKLPRAQNDIY